MTGYTFTIGPMHYVSHRDGTPFTLVDAWLAVRGVAQASIWRPDGSLVLRDAGSMSRRAMLAQNGRTARVARRNRAATRAALAEVAARRAERAA